MNSRAALVDVLHGVQDRHRRFPIPGMQLTRPQRQVLQDPMPVKLWRDGNQLGKSWWLALEVVLAATGRHPYLNLRRPPVQIMVFSVNKEQAVPLHEKIWQLLPKDEIDDRCKFDPGRGITGKPPRITFVRGPGKGSVIHFATYDQGARRAAGFTLVLVVLDEPPPAKVYGEVVPRVLRQNGRVLMGMTPTPDMADVSWLREKVEAGEISEHNFGLAVDNVWLDGDPTPMLTQKQIDEFERALLRSEREMRMRGAWEATVEGAWLDNFVREDHVRPFTLEDVAQAAANLHGGHGYRTKLFLFVGYDHGTEPNKEAIVIGAATGSIVDIHDKRVLDGPMVWAMNARKLESKATPELIVDVTEDMLEECGLTWENIDVWVGDREAMGRLSNMRLNNRHIMHAWAAKIGVDYADLPFKVETAYKPAGSVENGLRLINSLLAKRTDDEQPMAAFHPRTEELVQACERHQGAKKDPLKDILDAYRYPVMRIVRAGEWMTMIDSVLVA